MKEILHSRIQMNGILCRRFFSDLLKNCVTLSEIYGTWMQLYALLQDKFEIEIKVY